MLVTIQGYSDDIISILGDISDEIDALGRSPKLYIYSNNKLQFTVKTSFKHGFWEIYPLLDEKTFDGHSTLLESRIWDISMSIQGWNVSNRNSMILTIDSGNDQFEITKRRKI